MLSSWYSVVFHGLCSLQNIWASLAHRTLPEWIKFSKQLQLLPVATGVENKLRSTEGTHVSWHQCWSRQEVLAKAQETVNTQHLTFFLQMTCTPLDVLSDTQYNRYPRKRDSFSLSAIPKFEVKWICLQFCESVHIWYPGYIQKFWSFFFFLILILQFFLYCLI